MGRRSPSPWFASPIGGCGSWIRHPPSDPIQTARVALDDAYLYHDMENDEPSKNGALDRIYRYRLDRFDEIGARLP